MTAPAFRLRRAVPEDAAEIARVHIASWQSTYRGLVPQDHLDALPRGQERRRGQWAERIEAQSVSVFVAEGEAGVFGFVSGGAAQSGIPGYAGELYTLYLLREAQGRGAGRALVRELARKLRAQGFGNLALWVLQGNPARGFYERLGGRPVAEQDLEIGGARLREVALGWPDLRALTQPEA